MTLYKILGIVNLFLLALDLILLVRLAILFVVPKNWWVIYYYFIFVTLLLAVGQVSTVISPTSSKWPLKMVILVYCMIPYKFYIAVKKISVRNEVIVTGPLSWYRATVNAGRLFGARIARLWQRIRNSFLRFTGKR